MKNETLIGNMMNVQFECANEKRVPRHLPLQLQCWNQIAKKKRCSILTVLMGLRERERERGVSVYKGSITIYSRRTNTVFGRDDLSERKRNIEEK